MTSLAQAYLNDDYVSIYVNLPQQEQIIFYWSLISHSQYRIPRNRQTRVQLPNCEITHYNNLGCVIYINKKRAEFTWYEYDNNEPPQHRGKLVNFAEWEYDRDFYYQCLTHQYQQTEYMGYYAEPQPYEEEE
jgi:hypothetical protein